MDRYSEDKLPEGELSSTDMFELDLAEDTDIRELSLQVLSPDELLRANRYRSMEARRVFVKCRAALRLLVASYLQTAPRSVQFGYTERGKPYVRYPESGLHFNLSHSGTKALFVFGFGGELGIDIEEMKRGTDLDAVAEQFFSGKENEYLAGLDSESRMVAFYSIWTLKEAFSKAIGEGLFVDLRSTVFDIRDTNAPALERWNNPQAFRPWSLHLLPQWTGYMAAMAAPRPGVRYRLVRYTLGPG